ncbi:hypothetical protein RD055328_12800 [Companilactobacillus sp. RD055328]|uniref:hypothetical protein n=1 Tax=Companilactobacillus sp. RD055328 TaxID=2916634 RepID=UPI001FC87D5C|nr:hypothetical protein [Companilactobacillus sp. RD055328]GKQ43357.1 hypothetical protein RD055328_12800 [Companilactobacillus sp. RD055328]
MSFIFGKNKNGESNFKDQNSSRRYNLGFSTNQLDDKSNLLRILDLFFEKPTSKVLLVCSNNKKNNGMTFTRNIGKANSSLGKNTLIIDCDFKEQSLTKSFQFNKNTVGLTNILDNEDHVMDAINDIEPQLQILTAGSVTDENQFILKFSNLKTIIDVYKSVYDLIVINTSEERDSFLSEVLYQCADDVILVTQSNAEKKENLNKFKKLIQAQSSSLLGVVFDG